MYSKCATRLYEHFFGGVAVLWRLANDGRRRAGTGAILDTQTFVGPQSQPPSDATQDKTDETGRGHKNRRLTIMVVALSTALVLALAFLAVRAVLHAKQAARAHALSERDRARKAAANAAEHLHQVQAARQTAAAQRTQARAAEKAAETALENAQAVLSFLRDDVLMVGSADDTSQAGDGKGVTLRQVIDTAETKIAGAFADRPLGEASIRQIFGATYLDMGETAKAIRQYERALVLREAELGPDHADTGDCRNQLAVAYRRADRADDASRLFHQTPLSATHAAALAMQGSALLAANHAAEAELKLRESLMVRQKIQPDDWTTFDAQSMLGAALLDQKKYAAAEHALLAGYEGMKQREASLPIKDRRRLTLALRRLVRLYSAWGKSDEASKWSKKIQRAEATKKR